jgi:hypothetical protein
VEVVLHSYRHRLGHAPSYPSYDQVEAKLATQPPITVPAVTLDGLADGNFPATDGSSTAHHFTGPRLHHQVPGAGYNLPQEAPNAFADGCLGTRGPWRLSAPREHIQHVTSNMTRSADIVPTARVTPATHRLTVERRAAPLAAHERLYQGD